ncbi:MAG: tRNA (adenosine(37)-N6)-threonylcarbamoyltransferase complex ATPase subunit type 1 TsaE [Clostridia bacterium]|nr:tRNA (adenosine(37)-N6)-threonylcarbamoyltransferase complex ATPase subunit type 1 TsaE [Clostridia bacterium]
MSRDECVIRGLESLKEFAKVFSKILKPGDIVYLKGDLGTGKTTFVKNVCRALGVKDDIASPTFTIMREYSLK